MIRKINGKNSTSNVGHLNTGDDVVTSKTEITFAAKSSSSNYSTVFQKFQNTKEQKRQIVARYARLTPSCKAGACTRQNSSMKNNKGH